MEQPTYFSLLPKDITNIVDLNVLMNMDYNEFIKYCQNNNCKDEIWKNKGEMDFKDFGKILGITNQAKYLRAGAKEEFRKLKRMTDLANKEKLLTELGESNYRHRAKLLDYNGRYDDFHSFNYVISEQQLKNIQSKNIKQQLRKYVPNNIKNWIVIIWVNKPVYFIVGFRDKYEIFYYKDSTAKLARFIKNIHPQFNQMTINDILRIYDVIAIGL